MPPRSAFRTAAFRTGLRAGVLAAGIIAGPFVSGAFADTVELVSGGTIVGTVTLRGADEVVVDAVFPEVATLTLKRTDVHPVCMHAILERAAAPGDAAKRRALGEYAEQHGLLALAISDFTIARTLEPGTAKAMDARIAKLNESVASEILDDAQELIDDDNPAAALMYLHTLREKYPESDAAKRAVPLAKAAHKSAGVSADVAVKTVSAEAAPRVLAEAEAFAVKGDTERGSRGRRVGSSVGADQRPAERAIVQYAAAWALVKTLPVAASEDPEFDERVARMRGSVKTRLVNAHLGAGSALLQRRSIAAAEKHINAAFALDPDNKDAAPLHWLVLQAKILGYTVQTPGPSSQR